MLQQSSIFGKTKNVFPYRHSTLAEDNSQLSVNTGHCTATRCVDIKENLISPKVSIQHIAAVINHEEDNELKIAPVLSRHHVEPGQYQKMRVFTAAQLLSHSTASVLRFCVQNGTLENDALTTAWFVDFINKWFDVVNARHYQFAMTPFGTDSVQVLHEMVDLASKLMF